MFYLHNWQDKEGDVCVDLAGWNKFLWGLRESEVSLHTTAPPQWCETERPGVKWPTLDRSRVRATPPSQHRGQPAAVCSSLTRWYPLLAFDWETFTTSTWLSAALKSIASAVRRRSMRRHSPPRHQEGNWCRTVCSYRRASWYLCISTSPAKRLPCCVYATCAMECSTFARCHKAESILFALQARTLHLQGVTLGENPLLPSDHCGGCYGGSPWNHIMQSEECSQATRRYIQEQN